MSRTKSKTILLTAIGVLALLGAAGFAAYRIKTDIDYVESHVEMPRHAAKLSSFVRYYRPTLTGLEAKYHDDNNGKGRVEIVASFPDTLDGGCFNLSRFEYVRGKPLTHPVCDTFIEYSVSEAEVAFIEAHVKLPEGALSMNRYERYYANDGDVVRVVYIIKDITLLIEQKAVWEKGQVHVVWKGDLPGVADGGCRVVTFEYDPKRKLISEPVCNGVA